MIEKNLNMSVFGGRVTYYKHTLNGLIGFDGEQTDAYPHIFVANTILLLGTTSITSKQNTCLILCLSFLR